MKEIKRAIFFTKDGLRSIPEEVGLPLGHGMRFLRRPCMERITNVPYSKSIKDLKEAPQMSIREYEFSKYVEWFDGDLVAYYCEI